MLSNLTYPNQNTDKAFNFLEKNTSFLRSLVANCKHDIDQLTTIIEPILNAPKRCEVAPFYIQAVTTGKSTFLVTNLSHAETVQIIDRSERWILGRSKSDCAIAIPELSISRYHAILGHEAGNNFFIKDAGSKNGTKVNNQRLATSESCILKDGDLIQFGFIQVEFFITSFIEESIEEKIQENEDVWLNSQNFREECLSCSVIK
ncbi:FHA domain-containing protein [Phormidium sp. LEGE 05292]|uniref:FHA domain-containing protein n=1 Tax=[Phormidium] sp. LEGE 05292 TaxID=767427 RepID=UPI0018818082|nr:FHA domain-containing protein [Phormidium sp. LEGE 05292]MBE9230022.1 FHA domain-containing protein [Phormidium sp. LEGE 05292]